MAAGHHGTKGQMGEKMDGKIEKRAQKAPKRHFQFFEKREKNGEICGFLTNC